ncbi:MAG: Glu-tRNA(Gln) amidotransferase subunit GatE [Candidatus Nanohaloarchaeota archaeon QJJ-9]|nr:Glu-tRNA(Gln) amidotransferase subunit GatE [Candidatus Nanohaloarchaeota archaeon QJJ-9]
MVDYEELGFKCGIEIHQQLGTDTKLFCNCGTDLENVNPDSKVSRSLRPVAGEEGEVDRAAKFEFLRDKEFVYHSFKDHNCLVELDEEPPHPIDREAMDIAVTSAEMLSCNVPDEIHVMRKTVIDGSNTSGFQRTAVVGRKGDINLDKGNVGIESIALEEESAGINQKGDKRSVFDLDRLGIPLIEIGTSPDINDPEHAKQAALKLGMILRSTGKVKRGLGTIRQDVNVSIDEGARVEIKGFQEVKQIDKLVENEVKRQKSLLEIKEELEERGIESIEEEVKDVTEVFEGTENQIIASILEDNGSVFAVKISFEGLMNKELCGGKTLGREFADYAKAYGLKGIMHTDEETGKYDLEKEFDKVRTGMGKEEGETVVIAAGEGEKPKKAIEAVKERAEKALNGVPEETRTANNDFTTSYARPLPGSSRMYPETDIPPFVVDEDYLTSIRENLPDTLEERKEKAEEEAGRQLAEQLHNASKLRLYENVKDKVDMDEREVANFLVNKLEDISSRYEVDTDQLGEKDLVATLNLIEGGEITSDAVPDVVEKVVEESKSPQEVVDELGLGTLGEEEVRKAVKEVLEDKKELVESQGEHAKGALMGLVMEEVKGEAEGSLVSRILDEELGKRLD